MLESFASLLFALVLVLMLVLPAAPAAAAALVRTQLHVHLDGAVTAETLFEVAQSRNLSLPVVGHPKSVRDVELLVALNVGFVALCV